MGHMSYSIRTFRGGDESTLAALSNEVHKQYIGFVPRTAQYWKWSYLRRPDVNPEGIFIIERSEGEVIGYGVVSCSGVVH